MAYSNGFDFDAILPVLKDRVGFRSATGTVRTYESFHTLCTEQNLKDVQPNADISDSDWTALKSTIEDDIIQRCLSSVFSKPEYLEQVLLHRRIPGSTRSTVSNSSLFCGIQFKIAPAFDIAVSIKKVHLLFDSARTFNLYLFQDGTPEAIETIEVTTEANKPTVLDIADLDLKYSPGSNVYYLGYFQDDLADAKAVREDVTCNQTKCFASINIQAPKISATEFNQSQISYLNDAAVGINAEVHSFRDYTDKILTSPYLFDEVIGLSMVYYVLEQILTTTRSNSTERILKGGIEAISLQHYLYGSIPAPGVSKTTGLNEIMQAKFSEIRKAFYPKPKAVTVSVC